MSISKPLRTLRLLPLALLLGASTALFLHGYWLVDLLPFESRQLLLVTILAGLASAACYFFFLKWIQGQQKNISPMIALVALPLAAFVFFGGTSQWQRVDRYVTAALPRHHLRISVMDSENSSGTAITWFNTSLGDVSFNSMQAHGWTRQGDEMVLDSPAENLLTWDGRTGEHAELVMRGGGTGTKVRVSWNGQEEIISLTDEKIAYERSFAVPFQASQTLVLLLGLQNFYLPTLALLLLGIQSQVLRAPGSGLFIHREQPAMDRRDSIILVSTLGLCLIFRAFNLNNVFPAVDEYYHLIAARQILEGQAMGAVYNRGLWLVTLPIASAFRFLGQEVWVARLVGVLFNSLAIIPLYMFSRKISRSTAIFSCALYVTSPWIITFARVAREYAYYPFYFYWIIYGMISFVQGIPPKFILVQDWKVIFKPKMILLGLVLSIPPVFALRIDWLSTFRTILIAYLIFGVFIMSRFRWREKSNWPLLGLLLVGLLAGSLTWYQEQSYKLLVLPRFNPIPIEYFLPNPQQQWYFERAGIVIPFGITAALVSGFLARRTNFIPLFVITLFTGYLTVFTLFSKTFFHTRHLMTTQLWYIVLLGIGLDAVWRMMRAVVPWKGKRSNLVLAGFVAAFVMNLPQVILPSISTDPDMPISEDYLHDLSDVHTFLLAQGIPTDALISTVYGLYATWEGEPTFTAQYRITSQTPVEEVFSIVDQYPSGWIVIDKIRFDLSSLSIRDFTEKDQIEYIGLFGDEYLWHWQQAATWVVVSPLF